MIPLLRNKSQQKTLFHIIHEDDIYLLNTAYAEWFQVLYYLPREKYLEFVRLYMAIETLPNFWHPPGFLNTG